MSKSSPAKNIAAFPRRYATTRRFTLGAPRSFSVADDGESALFLRSAGAEDPNNALWSIRAGESPRLIFAAGSVDHHGLTDAEKARRERMREQASGVVSYAASPAGDDVVVALGGALYRIDVASGTAVELTSDGAAFDPRAEPSGERVIYASGSCLRISDGWTDRVVSGTDEPGETISWGTAEFVAAEEMGRGRGYWWDPNGQRVAACRVDTAAVEQWWVSSPEDPSQNPRPIRYPAAGTANADVQLWIVDVDSGPVLQVDWQRGEFEYLADVQWGERLVCTTQTRDQRTLAILDVDPATGVATEVQRIEDEHWVELQPKTPHMSDIGVLMVVDDGNRTISVDGISMDLGAVQVRELLGVFGRSIYATVTTDATDSVVARIELDGEVETLTQPGFFASGVLGGGTLALTIARPDGDSVTEIRWVDGSVGVIDSLAATPGFACTPTFSAVGERRLNVAVCLPDGHDGSPLPVLLDPYGGPHAQRVLRARNAFATSQWFAEQGFAVVVIDGRGTPGRGPAFEREIRGDFASAVLEDQIDALYALAETETSLDLTRVGIRGWSFGGYLAALAVMRRPDAVHAAVAGAPVTDWALYDTHYTERYLGHPSVEPHNYERSSLLHDAGNLGRPMMLIHGLADDNVVAAHTLVLSRALLEAGRPHEVLPLSGVTHMTPQEQVAENLLHLQRDFLKTHLT